EKGKYSTIDIKYIESNKTLTIGKRNGSFDGMLNKRRFNIVVVSKDRQKSLNLVNPDGKMIKYIGNKITIKL
ncbi:MAG TPA: DUF5110 domain-containing protein, partial [Xylanibacter oryzae]|nr:DUF5110 domain-containing protein [Xylanibacter oryzae]